MRLAEARRPCRSRGRRAARRRGRGGSAPRAPSPENTRPGTARAARARRPDRGGDAGLVVEERPSRTRPGRSRCSSMPSTSTTVGERIPGANPAPAAASWATARLRVAREADDLRQAEVRLLAGRARRAPGPRARRRRSRARPVAPSRSGRAGPAARAEGRRRAEGQKSARPRIAIIAGTSVIATPG